MNLKYSSIAEIVSPESKPIQIPAAPKVVFNPKKNEIGIPKIPYEKKVIIAGIFTS